HALGSLVGRQAGTHGEAAAYALGNRHHVRLDRRAFLGKEPARAADAALDLVENQQDAVVVAELAQLAHRLQWEFTYAALALDRLDKDGRRLRRDRLFGGFHVVEGNLVEALDLRPETFQIFLLAAGR